MGFQATQGPRAEATSIPSIRSIKGRELPTPRHQSSLRLLRVGVLLFTAVSVTPAGRLCSPPRCRLGLRALPLAHFTQA